MARNKKIRQLGEDHRQNLTAKLEAVGLRLNKRLPQIHFKRKKPSGISFGSTAQLSHVDENLCYQILQEHKTHNAEAHLDWVAKSVLCILWGLRSYYLQVLIREDDTVDDLIDVIEGNRKYVKCVYVYNKIDVVEVTMLTD